MPSNVFTDPEALGELETKLTTDDELSDPLTERARGDKCLDSEHVLVPCEKSLETLCVGDAATDFVTTTPESQKLLFANYRNRAESSFPQQPPLARGLNTDARGARCIPRGQSTW